MKLLTVQALTSLTATGIITFTVTHMHQSQFHFELLLWLLHRITAWPIAFVTVRWIAPIYHILVNKLVCKFKSP